MTTIQLKNGRKIKFDGNPSEEEINKVVAQIEGGGQASSQSAGQMAGNSIPTSFGPNANSSPAFSDDPNRGNVVGSVLTSLASPFAKTMATAELLATKKTNQDYRSDSIFRPFGNQAMKNYQDGLTGGGEAALRVGADAVGTAAEIASYFVMAPLKITGSGFKAFGQLLKQTAGVSALIGAGAGGESLGQGESATSAALKTGASYVGATAAFGIMDLGGRLVNNYGSKLLRDKAIADTGHSINDSLKNMVETKPELLSEAYAKDARKTQNYLLTSRGKSYEETFNRQMIDMRNKSIDNLLPKVDNPDLITHDIYRGMSDKSGVQFKNDVNLAYDGVKAQTTVIKATPKFTEATKDMREQAGKNVFDLSGKTSYNVADFNKLIADAPAEDQAQMFMQFVDGEIKEGVNVAKVLNIMENSFTYMAGADAKQLTQIRNITGALRNDIRAGLPTEDIKAWDLAHAAYQKAGTIYSNPALNKMKNSGFAESIVDGISKLKASPERDFMMEVLNSSPERGQELLVNTVLRRTKQMSNKDAAKYIDDFLNGIKQYDGTTQFLSNDQTEMLEAFRDFSKQDLMSTTMEMQNKLGMTSKEYQAMSEGLETIDIFKEIKAGKFDDVAENFNQLVLREPRKIEQILQNFDTKEKNAFGTMVLKDLYEKRNIAFMDDPNNSGFQMVGDDFKKTYADIYSSIKQAQLRTGDSTLSGMFTKDEIFTLEDTFKKLNQLTILDSEVKHNTAKQLMDGVTTLLYLKMGYVTGAARSGSRMFSQVPTTGIPEGAVKQVLQDLRDTGVITEDSTMPEMIDFLNRHFATPLIGNTIGQTTEPE